MKSLIPILGVLLTLNLLNASLAQQTGSIIPLYVYPHDGGNAWQPLLDAHRAHPIPVWAIVNVYNGPGDGLEPNFVPAVQRLHAAGINTLGYVKTEYGQRSQNEVKAEIDRWKAYYNVNGIFFDEMANDDNDAHVNFYREVNNYAKSMGYTFTVGNPGTSSIGRYFDTVDNIVIFETDTGFPSNDRLCSQDRNGKGIEAASIMPYNIPNLNAAQVNAAKQCVGFIYVQDDVLPNPWDTLPNYLTELFRVLRG